MIQRIQTLYMILVVILMGVVPHFLPLYEINGKTIYFDNDIIYTILFIVITMTVTLNIFGFKDRKHQFVSNRISIILNFLLVGFMVYRLLNVSGGTAVPEKGIGMILPLLSIFLLSFANKAIKRDEDLVKSVDRIR